MVCCYLIFFSTVALLNKIDQIYNNGLREEHLFFVSMASFLELIKTKYLCDLNQEVFQLVLFILNPRIFLAPVSPLFHGLLIPDVCVFYKRVCFFLSACDQVAIKLGL